MGQECIRTVYGAGYRLVLGYELVPNDNPLDGMTGAVEVGVTRVIERPYSVNDLEAV